MKNPTMVPACRVGKDVMLSAYYVTCEPDMMNVLMVALSDSGAHLAHS